MAFSCNIKASSSYVGIIHIRYMGRRSHLPLSLSTSSPVSYMKLFYDSTKKGSYRSGNFRNFMLIPIYFNTSLRWHYPHQVIGSKFTITSSQPASQALLESFYFYNAIIDSLFFAVNRIFMLLLFLFTSFYLSLFRPIILLFFLKQL